MSTSPQQVPEGAIIITPAEVYAEVRSLTEVVRELVAKDRADNTAAEMAELKKDVTTLKRAMWVLAGALLAYGPVWNGVAQTLKG